MFDIYLLQNCKTYAKKVVKYVPAIGWGWKFAESIFLERNWDKDKDVIGRQICELADHPDPIWVSIYFNCPFEKSDILLTITHVSITNNINFSAVDVRGRYKIHTWEAQGKSKVC